VKTSRTSKKSKVVTPQATCWQLDRQIGVCDSRHRLQIQTTTPGVVRWTNDDWATYQDSPLTPGPGNLYVLEFPSAIFPSGSRLEFTFFWTEANRWEGRNFVIAIA
jgi:glucoamylase